MFVTAFFNLIALGTTKAARAAKLANTVKIFAPFENAILSLRFVEYKSAAVIQASFSNYVEQYTFELFSIVLWYFLLLCS